MSAERKSKIRVIVVGASGYSGAEAVGILLRHPSVDVAGLFGSLSRGADDAAPALADLFPRFVGRTDLRVPAFDASSSLRLEPDVALLATPAEAGMEIAPRLLAAGVKVIDIGAAFRFKDAAAFAKAYGVAHTRPDLCESAAYGLPEINRAAVAEADLIACAGCYVTSALVPLVPLARAGAIDASRPVIIDSTSGVSGAGRAAAQATHFCEVSLQPYKVLSHKHAPEIESRLGLPAVFTPHLGAFDRGILSTIHVALAPGWSGVMLREELSRAHAKSPFVRLLRPDAWPSVSAVRGANFCDIGVAADDARRHAVIVSALDNLVKGAAGQAVQCLNIRFGLPETAGLL